LGASAMALRACIGVGFINALSYRTYHLDLRSLLTLTLTRTLPEAMRAAGTRLAAGFLTGEALLFMGPNPTTSCNTEGGGGARGVLTPASAQPSPAWQGVGGVKPIRGVQAENMDLEWALEAKPRPTALLPY
jgi:hypothetical protein